MMLLAAVAFATLHMIDGHLVLINPAHVTVLREAREEGAPGKQLTDGVRCVIRLTDATYVAVVEDCETTRRALEAAAAGQEGDGAFPDKGDVP